MLDISVGYNKYIFLGNDFLTWIWFVIEKGRETGQNLSELIESKEPVTLEIGNSLVLENKINNEYKEKITIKGDQAGLEEGTTALKKGAWVTQINLLCKINEDEYQFTLKGESYNLTGLKTPVTDTSKNKEEIEGLVLEKAYLCFRVFEVIDKLFLKFLSLRIEDDWTSKGLQDIKKWVELC